MTISIMIILVAMGQDSDVPVDWLWVVRGDMPTLLTWPGSDAYRVDDRIF